MIGEHRFDPATGAPLTENKSYPPADIHWAGARSPRRAEGAAWIENRSEALTNGELQSSGNGLLGYFRYCHRRVRERPNPDTEQAAAVAIHRLKTDREHGIDVWLWFALAERLARKGHWSTWMLGFAEPRCPVNDGSPCHSRLKWKKGTAYCAKTTDHRNVHNLIEEKIIDTYNAAFVSHGIDPIDELLIV